MVRTGSGSIGMAHPAIQHIASAGLIMLRCMADMGATAIILRCMADMGATEMLCRKHQPDQQLASLGIIGV